MGKKPAGEYVKPKGAAIGFEATPACGYCGARTRRLRPKWRLCEAGHTLLIKHG